MNPNPPEPHYVILRDDDTNALTPAAELERLYRPFLDRGLPVNLATIPDVRTDVLRPGGEPEGFLPASEIGRRGSTRPLAKNRELVSYLKANPGYRIVQHGCHHDYFEFELQDRQEVARRFDHGARRLAEAGFHPPRTFVAPYDRFSRTALSEATRRFRVVSSGWFERRRLPFRWWPRYFSARLSGLPHWQAQGACLLSHPGCILSRFRPREGMLDRVKAAVRRNRLTVLVTHWWEYFPDGKADEDFIRILHQTAEWLGSDRQVKVIAFDHVASGRIRLG